MKLPMADDFGILDKAFEPLMQAAAGNAPALLRLAHQARVNGHHNRAIALARAALEASPADPEINVTARQIIAQALPDWHVALVKDAPRNQAFADALARHVKPGMHVLDVGAGTGLLAMLAARSGAGSVISCEVNQAMASVAQEIVAANGYDAQVTILSKNSRDIDPATDMGELADLVVAEILGYDLVCEIVLPTMRDVVQRLAKPGARFIPQAGDIRVALAWWDDLDARGMGTVEGFDLSAFNQLLSPAVRLNVGSRSMHLRGPAENLFTFDFAEVDHGPDQTEIALQSDGGPVNGVVQWIRLRMDETAEHENQPTPGAGSSWACQFFPFATAPDLAAGQSFRIGATYRGNILKIWGLGPVSDS